MRKALFVGIIVGAAVLLSGCAEAAAGGGANYEFIDQNPQGVINGRAYEFVSGTAEDWSDDEWSISLYNTAAETSGQFDFGAYSNADLEVWIIVPKVDAISVHELFIDINTFESFTVTMVDNSSSPAHNIICSEGAVEITAVDLEAGTISGRLDIWDSGEKSTNHVTGNFSVPIDPYDL